MTASRIPNVVGRGSFWTRSPAHLVLRGQSPARVAGLVAGLLLTTPPPAPLSAWQSETDASRSEREAGAVYEAGRESLTALRTLRYSAHTALTLRRDALAVTIASEGQVIFLAPEPGEPLRSARLRVEGRLLAAGDEGQDVPFALISDGTVVRARIDDPSGPPGMVLEARSEHAREELLELARRLIVPGLLPGEAASLQPSPGPVAPLPDETLNETRCAVVAVIETDPERGERRVEWAFGVDDHLPRRVRTSFLLEGEAAEEVLTLTQIVTQVSTEDPNLFRLEPPEGGEVVAYGEEEAHDHDGPEAGTLAPDWTLQDAAGRPQTLSALRGRVVVLDFWATWCGPCVRAMPALERLHRRFEGQDVTVLGLSSWDHGEPVRLMRDKGYTYGLLLEADEVAERYGVTGLPTLFVIGTDGRVLARHVGFDERLEEKLASVVERHLRDRAR